MSRSYNDELQYLDKISSNCWRIKKGFVPNMQVSVWTLLAANAANMLAPSTGDKHSEHTPAGCGHVVRARTSCFTHDDTQGNVVTM